MLKNEIRETMKQARKSLSAEEVKQKSFIIINKLKEILDDNYDTYFIYNDFDNEVCTKQLIEYLLEQNKKVFLPKIIKDTMFAAPYNKQTTFSTNKFKINEPNSEIKEIDNFICVTPILAIDKKGNRIGYGKGYYDKFFKNKKCLKIGLCFDFQIIENIKSEPHDIPLDIIISENRTIKTTKAR